MYNGYADIAEQIADSKNVELTHSETAYYADRTMLPMNWILN